MNFTSVAAGPRIGWTSALGGLRPRAVSLDGGEHVLLGDPPARSDPLMRIHIEAVCAGDTGGHRGGVSAIRRGASAAGLTSVGSAFGCTGPFAAAAPASIRQSTDPTATVWSASTRISAIVPATGDGTSASTLSVEISTSGSSTATESPTFTRHSRIGALGDRIAHFREGRRRPARRRRSRPGASSGAAARLVAVRALFRRARFPPEPSHRLRRGSLQAFRPLEREPRRRPCRSRSRRAARPPPRGRQPASASPGRCPR